MSELPDEREVSHDDLTDWQYVVMISLLRINDALGALLEEIRSGAGRQLYDIHKDGQIIMPEPRLSGDFGVGFGSGEKEED